MAEYVYKTYGRRSIAKWPRSKEGIDADVFNQTKQSLLESIRKAKASLAVERAGGRRRALEQSIERAKVLIKELEKVR